jgi:hypothetical protein
MRDLGEMLAHVHDAEIEISEGPGPPARMDTVQNKPGTWCSTLARPALVARDVDALRGILGDLVA